MSERRLESRFLCADLVRVTWFSGDGTAQTADAVLEDISHLGACVQVEETIVEGAPVHFTIGASTFTGNVSYCVYRDYGYFVGIRFSGESAWSRDLVLPQHLINPQSLGR
jgi:hypothetical protein